MTRFSALVIGHESLTVQCASMLREAGHAVAAIVSDDASVTGWARSEGIAIVAPGPGLADRIGTVTFDWIISAANLALLPEDVLSMAGAGAVNFHDGPLPAYAGLNAPVWALLNGETRHGVAWHLIEGDVDEGRIVAERPIDISPRETAFTLNAKCYAAGIESFGEVIASLAAGVPEARSQDLSRRSCFARADRPAAAAMIDFSGSARQVVSFVRALDHGGYDNPLAVPKLRLGGAIVCVSGAQEAATDTGDDSAAPGTVLRCDPDQLVVACGTGAVALSGLTGPGAWDLPRPGECVDQPGEAERRELTRAMRPVARAEPVWRRNLARFAPAELHLPGTSAAPQFVTVPDGADRSVVFGAMGALCARLAGGSVNLALGRDPETPFIAGWVPVGFRADLPLGTAIARFAEEVVAADERAGMALDLPLRVAGGPAAVPDVALAEHGGPVHAAALTLDWNDGAPRLVADPSKMSDAGVKLMVARLEAVIRLALSEPEAALSDLPLLTEAERQAVLYDWNATGTPFESDATIPTLVSRFAAARPDQTAIIFEDETVAFGQVEARANRIAHVLQQMGVARGDRVGLFLRRSVDLVIAALAIQKAGAAYVPLDPAYPAERLALYLEDSGASVILTASDGVDDLPVHDAPALVLDRDPRIAAAPAGPPDRGPQADDLAYLIYTSGSTGRPKGVMVSHRNVMNFFAGMDARIPHEPGDRWLAVTSMSFDISVLELFWTLARGLTVAMSGDEDRTLVSSGRPRGVGGMEFSLFYWGNDDGDGRDKYRLLLDGARFADANGFSAIWTPERHFHAFGGPYPNPAVTGAAVAAVTERIGVRAGSCVAPLHHPARIAEEWAVIDNLTNGRAGLAIAAGWQPDDFVLRPENAPPGNKSAMFEAIDQLRALWRGEPVAFPTATGTHHSLVTQPRPVSTDLPIWITTAGNPETWANAGRIGANVLTHLLGQSVAEVGEKIAIYHAALREAGHDPARFSVTLMLHTFLGATREEARETAREPMKAYLRSATGLIKQYAWAFPAFKRPAGVDNASDVDLGSLEEEELDGIMDFAFERYFSESGLFGTVDDALERVEQVRRIGVTEVACLIDYGIAPGTVLDGLGPLAAVCAEANRDTAPARDDFSIAAQIERHDVTHLQCTPSMARMLVSDDASRAALRRVRHLMIGGEALPGALVADLSAATDARIENMYGPTETTVWSTTRTVRADDDIIAIGTPIANTRTYVLTDDMTTLPRRGGRRVVDRRRVRGPRLLATTRADG